MKIKLLDKYIFKQVITATILGILLFIVVWISPEILLDIIRDTVYGEISPKVAVQLLIMEIPEILGKAIPVGLLLGCLYVFDKLSKNFELIIMRSTGISFKRMVIPVLIISIVGCVLCYKTYDTIIPYSTNKIKQLKNSKPNTEFVYIQKDANQKPKQAVIVTNFDGQSINNVKVLQFAEVNDNEAPLVKNILIADKAVYNGQKWTLEEGIDYKIAPDGVYEKISKFNSKQILDGKQAQNAYKLMAYSVKKPREIDSKDLASYISLLKSEDLIDEYNYMLNKLYQRDSQAFSCILLAICGVILGFSRPREKRFLGYTVATGLVFVFYIIVPFLDLLAQKSVLPPILTAWIPCLLVVGVIFALLKYKEI